MLSKYIESRERVFLDVPKPEELSLAPPVFMVWGYMAPLTTVTTVDCFEDSAILKTTRIPDFFGPKSSRSAIPRSRSGCRRQTKGFLGLVFPPLPPCRSVLREMRRPTVFDCAALLSSPLSLVRCFAPPFHRIGKGLAAANWWFTPFGAVTTFLRLVCRFRAPEPGGNPVRYISRATWSGLT